MDSCSESSGDLDLNDLVGLPVGGFEIEDDSDVEDENVVQGVATPLFSLLSLEKMVLESDSEALDKLNEETKAYVESREDSFRNDKVVELELNVLEMAGDVARGDFLKAFSNPVVVGLLEEEKLEGHSVSRVRNRIARFLHGRVVEHINHGLGNCAGRDSFKDPSLASPESHVNQRALRAVSCVLLGAACLGLYTQANWTGPPINASEYPFQFVRGLYDKSNSGIESAMASLDADARASGAISGKDVGSDDLDPFPELHARCALMLGANGESVYRDAKYLLYLYVARIIFRVLANCTMVPSAVDAIDMLDAAKDEEEGEEGDEFSKCPKPSEMVAAPVRRAMTHIFSASWFSGRSASVHQQTIESNVSAPSLLAEAERGFLGALAMLQKKEVDDDVLKARLWLECGITRHNFGRGELAKEAFESAKELAGLNVKLSGALGSRTKFQKDKAQLVLHAASASTAHREQDAKGVDTNMVVKLEEVDQDTPLHESVQYQKTNNEQEALERSGKLSLLDQSIVLALCIDVKNSYAMEGLTAEEMLAYTERIVQNPDNWMVYSTGLLIKSQLEFERYKTKERAVLQMQVLVDQQSDRLTPFQSRKREVDDSAPVQERFKWLYGLAWPAIWDLKRGLAERYLDLGVAASALQIFEQVKLWEQAADCLVMMDKRARAEKLVRSRLEVEPSANLMCTLGNLLDDPEWYRRAWEFSEKRYARSKRLWATHAFSKGAYHECIQHLQDALAINPRYPGSWFRLGTAAMRVQDWQVARNAFANVTKQEPEDGDAWANLSTVLASMGDPLGALKAVEDAARHSRNNYKVWENYIMLSLSTNQLGMAINGISNLIDVRHVRKDDQDVDVQALLVVVDSMITLKERIEHLDLALVELFAKIKAECKSDPNVWKIMSLYYAHVGDHVERRDCLMRRVRAMQQQNPSWERDESKIDKITKIVIDVYKTYMSYGDEDPEIKKQASALVQSTLETIQAGPYSDEKSAPLLLLC
mmetsp:Transcript_8178/g.15121  ORF Transcript_8178/g.15121 Transcript_8178/m.15121 type:complete len:993 (+) Transcript_8178:199-3177(+)